MPSEKPFDLPYFDIYFRELERGETQFERLLDRNVHWGYWPEPEQADASLESFHRASEQMTRELLTWAEPQSGQSLLDVGCGFGGTLALLNETHTGLKLTGLNIDARQIARAQEKVSPSVRASNSIDFVVGDACQLPFPDASFDTVTAVECIFHFPSRRRFFREAYRVLKPGGRLVLSDFVMRVALLPVVAVLFPFYAKDSARIYGGPNQPASLTRYRWLARTTGFKLTGIRDVTRHTMPTYEVLRKYAPILGSEARSFTRANDFVELLTRLGALRYDILAFGKAT